MKLNKLSKKKLIKMIYDLENNIDNLKLEVKFWCEQDYLNNKKTDILETSINSAESALRYKEKEIDHKDSLLKSLINS